MSEPIDERTGPAHGRAGAATIAAVGACLACCAPLLLAAPPLAAATGIAVAGGVAIRTARRRRHRNAIEKLPPQERRRLFALGGRG